MAQRTCEVEGCERRHQARGLCGPHYGTWHRRAHGRGDAIFINTCIECGSEWQTRRAEAKYCTVQCKGDAYRTKVSPLPIEHPVTVLISIAAQADAAARAERRDAAKRSKFQWRTARECPGCACLFTPLYTPNAITCSKRCSRRVGRWRRNAAEREAVGTFTWSQFMHIARRFDYRCAYCGDRPGQLDPDHVVPLSRGGDNSTTNLLPSCRQCNSDKRDLMLNEWATDREERGKPPRFTNWAPEDKRYWHLTQEMLRTA